jgi:hypothetical protein
MPVWFSCTVFMTRLLARHAVLYKTPLNILQNLQSCGKFCGPFALFWCFCFTFSERVWKSLFFLVAWSADMYVMKVSLVAFWDTSGLCLLLVLQVIWAFARDDILSTGTSRNVFPFLVLWSGLTYSCTSYNHPETAVVQSQLHKYSAHKERNCLTGRILYASRLWLLWQHSCFPVLITKSISHSLTDASPRDWLQTTSEFVLCSMVSEA